MGQITQVLGTANWMMPGAMGSMMWGPVVGPDGTIYLLKVKVVPGTGGMMGGTAATSTTQLVAILAGAVSWTLDLDGWVISRPVVAPDGNILLTESFSPAFVFGLSGSQANAQERGASLVVITPTGNSARIAAQTQVDTDALSQPSVVTLPGGSYQILATGFDMGGMMDAFNGRSGRAQQTSLYTFDSTGNLFSEMTP